MNFESYFLKGQEGKNKGLPMGVGLENVQSAINGTLRAMIYVIAAAAKGGKSTLVDAGFIIPAAMFVLLNNQLYNEKLNEGYTSEQIKSLFDLEFIDLEIIYNSYEISRLDKEFDFACHFLNHDYGITHIQLDAGVKHKGESTIELSSNYLKGFLKDDNDKIILVKPIIVEVLKKTYRNRIVPLFGEYDLAGNQISKGIITYLDHRENPTGVRNYLIDHAKKNGKINYVKFKDAEGKIHQKMHSYIPNNPDKYTLVITDHLRKLLPERGFNLKQTVDKFSEYSVELKNILRYTFFHIIHLNRSMSDTQRLNYQGDKIYPNSDDIKETGNLSEDCDFLFTMFNPNDDRFNLTKHFGRLIKDNYGNLLYPNMRTIHLVESRHTFYPQHFAVNMYGGIKKFEKINS